MPYGALHRSSAALEMQEAESACGNWSVDYYGPRWWEGKARKDVYGRLSHPGIHMTNPLSIKGAQVKGAEMGQVWAFVRYLIV